MGKLIARLAGPGQGATSLGKVGGCMCSYRGSYRGMCGLGCVSRRIICGGSNMRYKIRFIDGGVCGLSRVSSRFIRRSHYNFINSVNSECVGVL